MRSFDPNDSYDVKALAKLKVEPWMVEMLKLNRGYVHWGPGEDYQSTQGESWSTSLELDSWEAFGPWELDELNEVVNFYFELDRSEQKCAYCDGLDEIWSVPRGFGRVYRDTAKDDLVLVRAGKPGKVISSVIDLLALVGYEATREQVAGWDLRRRVEAVVHAATEYARASDNPVHRHPRPSWLPEAPWQGPHRGEGAFYGPSGTSIPMEGPR